MKKKLMLVGVLILSLIIVSCSGKKDGGNTPQLTVAQYKEEVEKIYDEIQEASLPLESINMADTISAVATAKEVIDKSTPLYEKLGALNAPKSLSDAHTKLKEGAEAALESSKVFLELLEFNSNPPADVSVLTNKMQEFHEQIADLRIKALGMEEAMAEIMAAE